jgi:CMP-N,N'-diacetyllegionaminic acid synthase
MLAIIPARGGSKGLPRKNVRLLSGLALICHSIKAALASKLIDRVIVSTEDREIASIAKDCGAEVPFMRPANLACDTSMVIDTYLHVVDRIAKENSKSVQSFVALLPTAPLRASQDIDNAIKIFNDKRASSVISVVEAPVPLQWHMQINNKKKILQNYFSELNILKNRQCEAKTYVPNGAIYVFRTEILRLTRQYCTDETYPYIMPRERSADIDDLLDFQWAEYLLNKKKLCNL